MLPGRVVALGSSPRAMLLTTGPAQRAQAPHRRAEGLPPSALPASISIPLGDEATPLTSTDSSRSTDSGQLRPLPRNVENVADDPSLGNPLQRMQRLGTGWMGVIAELEGVIVEDTADVTRRAWLELAEQEGRPAPLQFLLKRADGMKAAQVCLCL